MSGKFNKKGIEDVRPFIARIDQVKDISGFVKTAADLRFLTNSALFSMYIGQDDRQLFTLTDDVDEAVAFLATHSRPGAA